LYFYVSLCNLISKTRYSSKIIVHHYNDEDEDEDDIIIHDTSIVNLGDDENQGQKSFF